MVGSGLQYARSFIVFAFACSSANAALPSHFRSSLVSSFLKIQFFIISYEEMNYSHFIRRIDYDETHNVISNVFL